MSGPGFPARALAKLKTRYACDCTRFGARLGFRASFHGDQPGIGDCAIPGNMQWLATVGVDPTPPVMADWLGRMRALPALKSPADFFPAAV